MKPFFTNAKIVSANTPTKAYLEFHADAKRGDPVFVMSRGELVEFDRCPRRWLAGIESDETKSTEWGTLIDGLVLAPGRFKEDFVITPATYPATPKRKDDPPEQKPWNRNATYCAEWEENQIGKTIISNKLYGSAMTAVKRFKEDPEICKLIGCSQTQVFATAEYHDVGTKLVVPVKILLDLVPGDGSEFRNVLADLKTCASAAPFAWAKAVFEHSYHWQAAMYMDVYNAALPEAERQDFFHVLQENYPPYETGRRLLTSEFVELGRAKYRNALVRYCQCLKNKVWPGYDDDVPRHWQGWQFTEPISWMLSQ
jgi:hypothetical protein